MHRFHEGALAGFILTANESTRGIEIHSHFTVEPVVAERDEGEAHGGLPLAGGARGVKLAQGDARHRCLLAFTGCQCHQLCRHERDQGIARPAGKAVQLGRRRRNHCLVVELDPEEACLPGIDHFL